MPVRVVIIEDEVLLAMDIERVLAEAGFTIVGIAGDRNEALELAPEAELALVDMNLRDGLTGPDTAEEMAQRFGTRILYVTANPEQIVPRAKTAAGVVTKPFSDETLLQAALYSTGRMRTKPRLPGFSAF